MKRMLWILPLLVLLLAGGFFISSSRASTETAPYTVLETDDKIEVRLYDTLHLAKVSLPASDPKAENMDGAFMKLFRFIDGANDTGEKIAMTTPVIMQRTSTESSMSFVMPRAIAEKGTPKPKGDVTLDQLPSVKVVAIRFSGRSNPEVEKQKLAALQTWAKTKNLTTEGTPLVAYYDPPWTPGPFRRNEILLRLKAEPK
jgi:SOUL heme-binding protein